MTLEFREQDGLMWSYYIEPPQPLRIEPRQISGRVLIDHAAKVEFDVAAHAAEYPTQVFVAIHGDGTFSWRRPPGSVVYRVTVRDAQNRPVSADASVITLASIRQQFQTLRRS